MQTDYLKYLLDVSELGSFSAAAEKSFITPQGVRRAIGVLEHEVGHPLVVRDGRSVRMTEYGSAILKNAKAVLEAQEQLRSEINRIEEKGELSSSYTLEGYFHAAAFDTAFFWPLADSPREFIRSFRVVSCLNADVVKSMILSSGEPNDAKKIGVVALFSSMANKNADYISELAKHGYMLYPYLTFYDEVLVSSRSRFASQDSLTCDEIKNEPFVLLNADLKEVVDLEIAPSYCTLVPDSRFQRKLVESTEAISITPSINRLNAGGSLDSGLVQIPLVDGWEVTLAFVGNTGILDYDPVKRMVKALSVGYDHQDEAGGRRFILHFGNRLPG